MGNWLIKVVFLLSEPDTCGVMEQKDEGGEQTDSPCGIQTQPEQAGLCEWVSHTVACVIRLRMTQTAALV